MSSRSGAGQLRPGLDEGRRLADVRGEQPTALEQQLHELDRLLRREQRVLDRRVPEADRHRVVAEVAADLRRVVHDLDSERLELVARSHAGDEEELRRADRAGAQYQLAPDLRFPAGVPDPRGPAAVEVDPEGLSVGSDRQVVPPAGRLQPRVGGGAAESLALVDAHESGALEALGTEVALGRDARLRDGVQERLRHRVGVPRVRDGAGLLLERLEVRLHLLPAPSVGPGIEVRRVAGEVHHRVHRAGPAERLPAREVDPPAAQPLLGSRLVVPVELRLEQLRERRRDADLLAAVLRARFQQQHARAPVRAQLVGEHAARGAGPDDDVVVPHLTPPPSGQGRPASCG